MKRQIEITLTLQIETGDADVLDIRVADPTSGATSAPLGDDISPLARRMIEEQAPPSIAQFEMDFAERCVTELQLRVEPPSGGRTYVNLYPPKRYGSKRAANVTTTSGRAEIFCDPSNAADFKHAEVVENKGEPVAVKVYLTSAEAVEEAVELTRQGLSERS